MLFSPASFTKCVASTRTPPPIAKPAYEGLQSTIPQPCPSKNPSKFQFSSRVHKGARPSDHLKWRPIISEFCDPFIKHAIKQGSWVGWGSFGNLVLCVPPDPLWKIIIVPYENGHNSGARQIPFSDTTHVGKTKTNHLFGNGLYHLFMIKLEDGLWMFMALFYPHYSKTTSYDHLWFALQDLQKNASNHGEGRLCTEPFFDQARHIWEPFLGNPGRRHGTWLGWPTKLVVEPSWGSNLKILQTSQVSEVGNQLWNHKDNLNHPKKPPLISFPRLCGITGIGITVYNLIVVRPPCQKALCRTCDSWPSADPLATIHAVRPTPSNQTPSSACAKRQSPWAPLWDWRTAPARSNCLNTTLRTNACAKVRNGKWLDVKCTGIKCIIYTCVYCVYSIYIYIYIYMCVHADVYEYTCVYS